MLGHCPQQLMPKKTTFDRPECVGCSRYTTKQVQCFGAKSFADDLVTGQGIVFSRAASTLRSVEIQPLVGRFVWPWQWVLRVGSRGLGHRCRPSERVLSSQMPPRMDPVGPAPHASKQPTPDPQDPRVMSLATECTRVGETDLVVGGISAAHPPYPPTGDYVSRTYYMGTMFKRSVVG